MAKLNRNSASIEEIVVQYYNTKEKYDNLVKRFEAIKKDFYSKMDEAMGDELKMLFEYFAETYEVTKVKNTKIAFDIDILERCLTKDILKQIIVRNYQITNYEGLVKYLKSLGAESSKIKEFISTTKSVDVQEVDRLTELGQINSKVVEKAAIVTKGKPYYKVKKM